MLLVLQVHRLRGAGQTPERGPTHASTQPIEFLIVRMLPVGGTQRPESSARFLLYSRFQLSQWKREVPVRAFVSHTAFAVAGVTFVLRHAAPEVRQ